MKFKSLGLVILGGILVVAFGVTFLLASVQRSEASTMCLADPSTYPAEGINGWRGDQLANAGAIIDAAQQLSLGRDAQIIGIMAAMGESGLKNITYGDWETGGKTNPDGSPTSSIGLFQQQDWWGSVEDRMNPTKAAAMFFGRLNAVPGWQDMEPSHAIWRVQINSDKNHYALYQSDAIAVVDALSGPCGAGEWIVPARGTVSGVFGDGRGDHVHMGTDLADGTCAGPIWAASAGVVSFTGWNKGGGGHIWIEHADGVVTGYFHMKVSDILVRKGQTVEAGEQIGKVGNEGNSFGCHLHYEVKVDGKYVNPQTFMEGVGVALPR
ncbi:M23 family metallopeptidase [Microbacterium sp.]|uniref:M23 family metallopeptidase n=1 Tax=Microbacterium sp. TaxID=51671 RepID=UPI003A93C3EA